jgi:hypothetical protein
MVSPDVPRDLADREAGITISQALTAGVLVAGVVYR